MSDDNRRDRRSFLGAAVASIMAAEVSSLGAVIGQPKGLQPLGPIQQIKAGVLDVGYCDMGAGDGPPVLLLHGWPYDIHSYVDVAPMLMARGCRVIVPHLRGHGTTRFLDSATPRSGQQAAIGADVIRRCDFRPQRGGLRQPRLRRRRDPFLPPSPWLCGGLPTVRELENRLAAQPTITVSTITLDGNADGVVPATDGKSTAAKFVGGRQHRVIPNVGHNLPQEDPAAFAAAVWELASKKR